MEAIKKKFQNVDKPAETKKGMPVDEQGEYDYVCTGENDSGIRTFKLVKKN